MERTSYEQFVAVAGAHDLLTTEEERRLSSLVLAGIDAGRRLEEGDTDHGLRRDLERGIDSRNRLIVANQRLVLKHARRFSGGPVDLLDLVQEGNLALLRAAEKFDGRKGFRFSTYADSWISAYMAICSAETRSAIRIPKKVYSTIEKVQVAADRLTTALRRRPTTKEIAAESGLEVDEVLRVSGLARVRSLDAELVDGQRTELKDMIADVLADDPSERAISVWERDELRRALADLPEDLRWVVAKRHGLAGEEPRSKTRLARELGVATHVVSRMEEAGLDRICEAIGGLPRVS